jgi:hypothetical protein
MPKYPKRLRIGTGQSGAFELRPGFYSIRLQSRADSSGSLFVVHDDRKVPFAVYKGRPQRDSRADEIGPVYSAGPGGPIAVPTGRVFVRLTEGVRPEQRRDEFAAAGFDLERTLSYAPQAAWLKPMRGGVARALPGLAALEKVPGVVHVEPQMLLERSLRDC